MSNQAPGAHPGDPRPDRTGRRTLFRVLGPLLLLAAVALFTVAFLDLTQADLDHEPTKFWMFFVGIPVFAIGGFLTNLGFAGAHARYLAGEYSPAIQSVSRDLGMRSGPPGSGPYCRSCGTQNDADARFCDGCGTSMDA